MLATVSDCLTFARSNGGRFQINPGALTAMLRYTQDAPEKTEAGGVLLGRHILETNDIIVDRITEPMLGDRRSRFRFFRARRRHQDVIDQVWRESNGTCTYLGEWHTHPEATPTPSGRDYRTWQRKLWHDQFTEPIFFVIAGTEETRVWEGWQRSHPVALQRM